MPMVLQLLETYRRQSDGSESDSQVDGRAGTLSLSITAVLSTQRLTWRAWPSARCHHPSARAWRRCLPRRSTTAPLRRLFVLHAARWSWTRVPSVLDLWHADSAHALLTSTADADQLTTRNGYYTDDRFYINDWQHSDLFPRALQALSDPYCQSTRPCVGNFDAKYIRNPAI